jgi:hypothetical protein
MKVPFTAEVCARAIIAACASYGDDPLKITTFSVKARRGLAPAASAVRSATGHPLKYVCRAMGGSAFTVHHAEKRSSPDYLKAKTAALAAIGGASATLAPEPGQARRPIRPDPETVSDLPDALLAPRPIAPPIAVEVVETKALSAPKPAKAMSDRAAQICEMFDEGRSPANIARPLGVTIGVVSGVRYRYRPGAARAKEHSRIKAPRDATSRATRPAKPEPDPVAGRAEPATRFERLAPTRDDRIPQPTRDAIAPTDQALIAEALAKGNLTKLPTAVADGGFARGVAVSQPAPLRFDPVKRKFSRGEGATQTGGFNT